MKHAAVHDRLASGGPFAGSQMDSAAVDMRRRRRLLLWGGVVVGVLTYVRWLGADVDSGSDRLRADVSGSGELVEGVSAGPYIFFGAIGALLILCGTIIYASGRQRDGSHQP